MGFLKQNKDTNVKCYKCRGNGIINVDMWKYLAVCKRCGGHGWVDWVAGAVEGSIHKPNTSKEIQLRVAHQNIDNLRHKIIDIGMGVGVHLVVNIKTIDYNERTMAMMPSLIKLGGKTYVQD